MYVSSLCLPILQAVCQHNPSTATRHIQATSRPRQPTTTAPTRTQTTIPPRFSHFPRSSTTPHSSPSPGPRCLEWILRRIIFTEREYNVYDLYSNFEKRCTKSATYFLRSFRKFIIHSLHSQDEFEFINGSNTLWNNWNGYNRIEKHSTSAPTNWTHVIGIQCSQK